MRRTIQLANITIEIDEMYTRDVHTCTKSDIIDFGHISHVVDMVINNSRQTVIDYLKYKDMNDIEVEQTIDAATKELWS